MSKYWMKPETPRRMAEAGEAFSRLVISSVHYGRRRADLERRLCVAAEKFLKSARRFAAAAAAFDGECSRFVKERGEYVDAKAEVARRMREWIPFARALVFGPAPKEPAPPRPVDVGIPNVPAGISLKVRRAYGDAIADVASKSARLLLANRDLRDFRRASGSFYADLRNAAERLEGSFGVFWEEDDLMRRDRGGSGSGGGVGRV